MKRYTLTLVNRTQHLVEAHEVLLSDAGSIAFKVSGHITKAFARGEWIKVELTN